MNRYWSIIIPVAGANVITNPSLELGTTGWTASGSGASIATTTSEHFWGLQGLEVTPGAGGTNGVYVSFGLTSGIIYVASVYIKFAEGVAGAMLFTDNSGTLKGTVKTFTGTGEWERIDHTWTADATATFRFYIAKNGSGSTAHFYLDGAVVEPDNAGIAAPTTYIDGDQAGCVWAGTAHASASSRPASYRLGGREVFLNDLNLIVTGVSGIGMPPQTIYLEQAPFLAGALYRGRRINERTLQLAITAIGSNRSGLHALRRILVDLVKPDAAPRDQEIAMRYYGGSQPVEMHVRYDSGLEFLQPFTNVEHIPLRLLAVDPYCYEDGDQGASLATQASVSMAWIGQRIGGAWSALGSGMNGDVYAIAIHPDGSLYVGGSFTTAGGVTVNHVARWDGSAWSALGSGTNGTVYALVIGIDGSVYIGGDITLAGGTTVSMIAKWDGSVWSRLGTATFSDAVRALAVGRDGKLYAGGDFSAAAGYYIAVWDGSTWSMPGNGFNGTVRALSVARDGSVYAGGDFTTNYAGTVDYTHVARWDGSSWSALGDGVSGGTLTTVRTLVIGDDGSIYAGGVFTTAGSGAAANIARWNGSAWSALGSGTNGVVYRSVFYNGNLLIFGVFTQAGDLTITKYAAIWNGTSWSHLDAVLPDGALAMTRRDEDLWIGMDGSGTAYTSAQTVVTNSGSATVYPIIKIVRTGGTSASVRYLRNETTDATLWINYDLQDGETLTIDLRPGQRMVESNYFGPMASALLRKTDLAEFSLLPGDNLIDAFVYAVGSPTVTTTLRWRVTHWSVDVEA